MQLYIPDTMPKKSLKQIISPVDKITSCHRKVNEF